MGFNLHPVRDFFNRVLPIDPPKGPASPRPAPWVLVDANIVIYAIHANPSCRKVLDRLSAEGRLASTPAILQELRFAGPLPWRIQILVPGQADQVFDQDVGNGKRASVADLSLLQAALEYPVETVLSNDSDLLWRAVTGPIRMKTGRNVRVMRATEYLQKGSRAPRHNPTQYIMPKNVAA
jgi:hypothetical protein